MRKILMTTAAAVIAVPALATASLAQGLSVGGEAGASAGAGAGGVSAGVGAEAGASAGAGQGGAGADMGAGVGVDAGANTGAAAAAGANGAGASGEGRVKVQAGQDTAAGARTNAQVGTQTGAEASGGANAAGQITVDTVLASIENSSSAAAEIESNSEIARVGVVAVDQRSGAEIGAKVDEAVSANEDQVAQLRSAIRSNAALNAKLQQGGLDVENVVAATFTANGELVLFTRG